MMQWKARHTVLAVLFFVWIVCFLDRMAMSTAIPYIAQEFKLSPVEMGVVMSAFFFAYAVCQIPGGLLGDRFGVRKVMCFGIFWWSVFTAVTGMAANLTQMVVMRVLFGLGEGIFPACSFKTISTYFPRRERTTANAIMLASNSLGPAVAPLLVVAIMSAWGWRAVFYCLCLPGILAILAILVFVSNHPAESKYVSKEELAEIESDDPVLAPRKMRIAEVFVQPGVWLCFMILFTFDITVWGFMAWLPTYLVRARGLNMVNMGIVASLPFFMGTIGCALGGWVSDRYFQYRRKIPVIVAELIVALCLYISYTSTDMVVVVICQTVAGGMGLFAIAALWALPMNAIAADVMGTAAGIVNMAGQIAAFVSPLAIGFLVQASGGSFNSSFIFLISGALISAAIALAVKEKKRPVTAAAAAE
jgi:sugar phosphate permease